MGSILFPDRPREFPRRRLVKIVLRGLHVVCASLCLGAYAFESPDRVAWLLAAIATGTAILVLDLHESAAFLFEVRGAVVVAKVAALAFVPRGGVWLLVAIAFLSVVSSHAPSHVRHRLLVGRGRLRASGTRG